MHNSCCGNYAFMAEKNNITSVIQHPVMLWLEKIFLHGKKHNKASSVQLFAALTLKAYGENRQWHKIYRAKLKAILTTIDIQGTGNTVESHIKKVALSYLRLIKTFKNGIADTLEKSEDNADT